MRFVILTHDHPFPHWDFMLESVNDLRTWRLNGAPDSPNAIVAEPLSPHRRDYLDYEGPVSGNRGEVRQWDHGYYELLDDTPQQVVVRLQGEKLTGTARLTLNKPLPDAGEQPPQRTSMFRYEPDSRG